MEKLFKYFKLKVFIMYYVSLIYVVSAWYTLKQLIIPHNNPEISHQKGRVALITGGGKGIGFETALQLLKTGMIVIIAGIREHQAEGIQCLEKHYENQVKFLACDFSSLQSVRQLAKDFKALGLPLHLLVNNAGVMFVPYWETEEGFESHWVINFLSHFLLTHLFLPTLIESAIHTKPSRVVNLASCLHYPGTINFKDTQSRRFYLAEAAYTQSKLAMVMLSNALARRLQTEDIPVIVNSVHPGVAFTDLFKHAWWSTWIPNLARRVLKTPAMASDTVIHAALSGRVSGGGNYYDNCRAEVPSSEAESLPLQEALWSLACQQTAIEQFGKPR